MATSTISCDYEFLDIRCYFNDDEWDSMSQLWKQRCRQMKQAYEMLKAVGIDAPVPDFMLQQEDSQAETFGAAASSISERRDSQDSASGQNRSRRKQAAPVKVTEPSYYDTELADNGRPSHHSSQQTDVPVRRGRGRPPKNSVLPTATVSIMDGDNLDWTFEDNSAASALYSTTTPFVTTQFTTNHVKGSKALLKKKKGRGRPRKVQRSSKPKLITKTHVLNGPIKRPGRTRKSMHSEMEVDDEAVCSSVLEDTVFQVAGPKEDLHFGSSHSHTSLDPSAEGDDHMLVCRQVIQDLVRKVVVHFAYAVKPPRTRLMLKLQQKQSSCYSNREVAPERGKFARKYEKKVHGENESSCAVDLNQILEENENTLSKVRKSKRKSTNHKSSPKDQSPPPRRPKAQRYFPPDEKRRYACKVCGAGFLYSSHRRRHEIEIHEFNVDACKAGFVCGECGAIYKRKDHLKRHELRVHNIKRPQTEAERQPPVSWFKYSCSHCEKKFRILPRLVQHEFQVHGSNVGDICSNVENSWATLEDGTNSVSLGYYEEDNVDGDPDYEPIDDPDHGSDEEQGRTRVLGRQQVRKTGLKLRRRQHFKIPSGLLHRKQSTRRKASGFTATFRRFLCTFCCKRFSERKTLLRHVTDVHDTDDEKHRCQQCRAQFRLKSCLKLHIQRVHMQKTCQRCQETFDNGWLFRVHLISCVLCTPQQLENDLETFNEKEQKNIASKTCGICGKVLSNRKHLKRHLETHEVQQRTFLCDMCGKCYKTAKDLKKHTETVHDKGVFPCDVCGRIYSNPKDFRLHRLSHSTVPHFDCAVCGKTFLLQCDLNRHLKTHSGNRSGLCAMCGRRFTTTNHLKRHMAEVHSVTPDGEPTSVDHNRFMCAICAQTFKRRDHLLRHERRVHANGRLEPLRKRKRLEPGTRVPRREGGPTCSSYMCSHCGAVFNRQARLTRHEANVHGIMKRSVAAPPIVGAYKFTCKTCGRLFKCKEYLTKHESYVHNISLFAADENQTYSCSHCDKTFKCRAYLLRHERSVHGITSHRDENMPSLSVVASNPEGVAAQTSSAASFQCKFCDAAFKKAAYLKRHIRVSHCQENEATTTSEHVAVEQSLSTIGDDMPMLQNQQTTEPCQCTVCSKMFLHDSYLQVHVASVHGNAAPRGERQFQCQFCDKKFHRSPHLTRHLKSGHGQLLKTTQNAQATQNRSNPTSKRPRVSRQAMSSGTRGFANEAATSFDGWALSPISSATLSEDPFLSSQVTPEPFSDRRIGSDEDPLFFKRQNTLIFAEPGPEPPRVYRELPNVSELQRFYPVCDTTSFHNHSNPAEAILKQHYAEASIPDNAVSAHHRPSGPGSRRGQQGTNQVQAHNQQMASSSNSAAQMQNHRTVPDFYHPGIFNEFFTNAPSGIHFAASSTSSGPYGSYQVL